MDQNIRSIARNKACKRWRDKRKEYIKRYNENYRNKDIIKTRKMRNESRQKHLDTEKKYYYANQVNILKYARDRTQERSEKWRQLLILLQRDKCDYCGYHKCQWALDQHHVNPSNKGFNISKFMLSKPFNSKNIELLKLELEKTITLCSNCHRESHYKLRKEILND